MNSKNIEHEDNLSRLENLPILFRSLKIEQLNPSQKIAVANIDAVLPQTQCGLCGHHDGCLPYAYSIVVDQQQTNLCVPGGQAVADAIAKICQSAPQPAIQSKWQIDERTQRPTEVRAVIREDACIGCTKCIPACPVDAIIGTAKHMHSIITDLCTGCELCIAPCPVDCIDLIEYPRNPSESQRKQEQQHLRKRYHHHLQRVAKSIQHGTKPVVSTIESAMVNVLNEQKQNISESNAKSTIMAAKLRTQIKKINKQLSVKDDEQLRHQLKQLQKQLSEI